MTRYPLVLATILALPACATSGSSSRDQARARDFASERISVVVRGRGPDVILIPGLAAHRDVWARVSELLDDRYRLHFVQLNGFAGFAPKANAEGVVAAPVAEEIARYVREAGLDRPTPIGHSMGGTMALMVAARHPGLVSRVMLVDSPPFIGIAFGPPGTTAETVRPTADQLRSTLLSDTSSSGDMLSQLVASMTRTESMRPTLVKWAVDSYRPTVANAMHEIMVTDLRPELARVTIPLTLLYVVPPNIPLSADEFERVLRQSFTNAPQTRFVRIDSSNHYIQIDQPTRFAAEVDAFMRR